jgi:hypothetical protein
MERQIFLRAKQMVHTVTAVLWSVNCIYITRRILVRIVLSLNPVQTKYNHFQTLIPHLRSI